MIVSADEEAFWDEGWRIVVEASPSYEEGGVIASALPESGGWHVVVSTLGHVLCARWYPYAEKAARAGRRIVARCATARRLGAAPTALRLLVKEL